MLMAVERDTNVRMFLNENEEHEYFMSVKVMSQRGEHRRQVYHAKEGHRPVIMSWFAQEVGGMRMLWCKRVIREMADDQD